MGNMSKERERIERVVPTNWLDPLLSGEKAVVKIGKPLTCQDVERLLLAVQERVDAAFRRELAKREARVRRIIKQQTRWHFGVDGQMTTQPFGEYIGRAELLATLAALRGKGTR